LWFNNDLLTFKATGAETGGAFLLVEELARRGKVTPLHVHPEEDETFYILEGQALLHLDGSEQSLTAGSFISVPSGVPHAYLVTSEVARSLVLVTPGSGPMEAFFRDAGEPAPERGLPPEGPLDIERIRAAAGRTGAVKILGPPPFGVPGA
jgi:quercetin dioxygenase-like cupin family protein